MRDYDVIVLGAGAAGMMAGAEAAKRGRSVLVVEHAREPGEKIRISGGGRCNFTNLNATAEHGRERFLSANPRFALSALSRYTPQDFVRLVRSYGIAFHEKTLGQLFCDGSALQIVALLTGELRRAGAMLELGTSIGPVSISDGRFSVALSSGAAQCTSLIVATGGKSIPKMGATGLGYALAAQFGLKVVETRPGLVPLTFAEQSLPALKALAGISCPAEVSHGKTRFAEALLFTHRGLSGPAILQISSYWREGQPIEIDLLPGMSLMEGLKAARREQPKSGMATVLTQRLPKRLAQHVVAGLPLPARIGDAPDSTLAAVVEAAKHWRLLPVGSEGYRTAEVTLGGVDTGALDGRTLEARSVPGLYFVGEVVDVTGWLGGYNFQWAWASGWAAGQVA